MKQRDPLWIDSHAHLSMFEADEVVEVLTRAADAGVGGVVVPATGADDLDRVLELGRALPGGVVTAAGVHPHEAATLDRHLKQRIEKALAEPGVVAVGEIGLDYHYMNSPREDQLQALEWQLDLSLEAGLPVVLHNRESWQDLEPRLAERQAELRGVCHSFTEDPVTVAKVVAMGLYVGVSGMVTFKAADNIRVMAAAVPLERLLVETDSPFLAPVPHRGKRNEPAYVPLVGHEIARLHGLAAGDLAERTTANVRSLFGTSFDVGS